MLENNVGNRPVKLDFLELGMTDALIALIQRQFIAIQMFGILTFQSDGSFCSRDGSKYSWPPVGLSLF